MHESQKRMTTRLYKRLYKTDTHTQGIVRGFTQVYLFNRRSEPNVVCSSNHMYQFISSSCLCLLPPASPLPMDHASSPQLHRHLGTLSLSRPDTHPQAPEGVHRRRSHKHTLHTLDGSLPEKVRDQGAQPSWAPFCPPPWHRRSKRHGG